MINNRTNSPELLSLIPFNVPSRNTRTANMFKIPFYSTVTESPLLLMLRLANNINNLTNLRWDLSFKKFKNMIYKHISELTI